MCPIKFFFFFFNLSRSIKVCQAGLPSTALSHGDHGNRNVLDVEADFYAENLSSVHGKHEVCS